MSAPIISVENLSKRYLVGHRAERGAAYNYTALRDVLGREMRNFGRKALDLVRGRQIVQGDTVEEYWALKDVSFEVQQGEVLGIIGRNGAGKSTLLKILSRITEPTSGRVTLRGRVASLLEVGTGFHPELSGRENVYLNGAILGMSRAEIRKKFDEIVAFAEVEKFLDTPVKRYSSGMYVRLAFAVAAHLEPEILIVDEVLAVGDAEFQKKCLGKMEEVSRGQGRTVLFVSHNISAIRQLCVSGILLEKGALMLLGAANDVADRYVSNSAGTKRDRSGFDRSGYTKVEIVDSAGVSINSVSADTSAFIDLEIQITSGYNVQAGVTLFNNMDTPIVLCSSEYGGISGLGPGIHRFRVKIPTDLLQPGIYRIEGAVWSPDDLLDHDDSLGYFQLISDRLIPMHGRTSSAQYVSREAWMKLP